VKALLLTLRPTQTRQTPSPQPSQGLLRDGSSVARRRHDAADDGGWEC
jgi:hypothetical protein